jgi:molybdopterin adenylyltransferase
VTARRGAHRVPVRAAARPSRGAKAGPAKARARTKGPALEIVRPPEHTGRQRAPRAIGCAVVTVSDTRRGFDDRSGARAHELLERAGFEVVRRAWVHDERGPIRRTVGALLRLRAVDCVVVTGGTGMAKRDVTPEAVAPLVQRELPGFGEMFRAKSAEQVGAAAWFSRASASVANGRLLVLLPGSTAAVELALERLLIPELAHAVRLLGRFKPGA